MARFNYLALRDDGQKVTGTIEGSTRSAVIGRLGEQGLHPIDVTASTGAVAASRVLSLGGGVASRKEISIFTRELAWLLDAGMSLNDALDILAKESFSTAFGRMVSSLRGEIRKGRSFHAALAETGFFSSYYVSMVEVGEATGTLAKVLERIAADRGREQKIRGRMISALTYPTLLVVLAAGAVSFIMVGVVPSIKDMISGSGAPVPESARFVISLSDWLVANGSTVLIAVPLALLLLVLLLGMGSAQRLAYAIGLRLPLIGSLLRKSAVVQFCRILGTLLAAGVSLPESLKLMRPSTRHPQIAAALSEMEQQLRQGGNFLAPLEASPFFPKLLARMLRVGNETGNLTPSIMQVTEIVENELDTAIDRTLTLLEPAIILALSAVVAFIIVSLMGAIISINDLAL